jgi:hypothetical protein
LSRPAACSLCNPANCSNGINCPDVRPEEVAIAALELLSEQTMNDANYGGIFRAKIESETNEQVLIR